MKIIKHTKPLEYLIVEDFYSDEEVCLINREIDFLMGKMNPPSQTQSAKNIKEEIIKRNSAVFLDQVYADRAVSDILTINRKAFGKEIIEAMQSLHPSFFSIGTCDKDATLINYYDSNDHYKPHRDSAQYTFMTFLIPENKGYTGGDFVFTDQEITIHQKNNMLLCFSGSYKHEVTPVKLLNKNSIGRISMTQFLYKLKYD